MEPPSRHTFVATNRSGRRLAKTHLRAAVLAALESQAAAASRVSLLLTDDDEIRALNLQFRGLDESTDVLSFPAGNFPWPGSRTAYLGDIAISVPYAERQAAARNVPLNTELGYLAIHGVLHLLGFEDEAEADRKKMVAAMNLAAKRAGLPPDTEWHSALHAEATS
jgi:rRNA maturation RNase YbeY